MVTLVSAATADVVTLNVANPCPAGTVTLAGTRAAAGLLLDRVTTAPPAGAAALKVSETCSVAPPVTPPTFGVNDATCEAGAPRVPLDESAANLATLLDDVASAGWRTRGEVVATGYRAAAAVSSWLPAPPFG